MGEQKKASDAAMLSIGDECQKAKQRKQMINETTNVRKTRTASSSNKLLVSEVLVFMFVHNVEIRYRREYI